MLHQGHVGMQYKAGHGIHGVHVYMGGEIDMQVYTHGHVSTQSNHNLTYYMITPTLSLLNIPGQ